MLNIYKASAGSGKTFNLAYWYIKLLLGEKNPLTGQYSLAQGRTHSHAAILAVTFTNKATQEMKERIIAQLARLGATPYQSDYIGWLKKDLNTEDVEAISKTAREALASLLYSFSLFNISTIDSFFQQILRSFAIEIDRPGNFSVELDDILIRSMAVDELFENIDSDKDVKEWIRLFMRFKFERNESINLFNKDSGLHDELVSTINFFITEKYRLNREVIDKYLSDPDSINKFYDYLTGKIYSIRKKISNEMTAAIAASEPFKLNGSLKKFYQGLAKDGTYSNIPATAKAIADGNTEKIFNKSKDPIPDELKQKFVKVIQEFCETYYQLKLADVMRKQLFFFGLLGKINNVSDRICRDNNIILLSNTNELINRIIGDVSSISPFIYERVGSRLHNFLMDEFQDTSALQWLNMRPLLEESLAALNDNLIIGDEKQCIYRFRNSNPELLGYEVKDQIEPVAEVDVKGDKIEENNNWRSAPEIVRFNNTLFYALGNLIDPASAYSHVMQGISSKSKNYRDQGHVKVRFINSGNLPSNSEDGEKKKARPKTKDIEAFVLEEIVGEINRLLQFYSPGEIAILVEENKQGEKIISRLLKAMEAEEGGVPELPRFEIVSNDALKVSSASSVKMLINQLRLGESIEPTTIDQPDNGKQWVKRTASDFAALEHKFEQYFSEFKHEKDSAAGRALRNALSDNVIERDVFEQATLDHQCNDLVSLVERLIGALPERMRHEETIFLAAFQDLVISFTERGNGDLRGFLQWWDKVGAKAKINSPENKRALTVSTIHKSKGLEYPCVVIPFANWTFQTDSTGTKSIFNWFTIPDKLFGETVPFAPEMLPLKKEKILAETALGSQYEQLNHQQRIDALNLTYVAFTRAKRELVVFVQEPYSNKEFGLANLMQLAFETPFSELLEKIDQRTEDAEERELLHGSVMDFSEVYDAETCSLDYGATNRRDIDLKKAEKKVEIKSDDNPVYEEKSELMPLYKAFDNEHTLKFMHLTSDEDYDPENARTRGIYMHYVLSKVSSPSSLWYACLQRGQKISMHPKVIRERYLQLKNAIEQPEVRRWFYEYERVATERAILDKQKERFYRPDRVVWTADGYIDVVDFKFGDRQNFEKYERQVHHYVKELEKSGYRNVRGYLWYPLDNFVHCVIDDSDSEGII